MWGSVLHVVAMGAMMRGSHELAGVNATTSLSVEPSMSAEGQLPLLFEWPCTKCRKENLCKGQNPIEEGTPSCLPVVCLAVCECRVGLPDVPLPQPIAIVPLTPPKPSWSPPQIVSFCACVGVRLANCKTPLCEQKIKEVMTIVECDVYSKGR